MPDAFYIVMRLANTALWLLLIVMGGIWILQGFNIAFLDSFMAGDRKWALYGAILILFGIGQIVWTNTRRR